MIAETLKRAAKRLDGDELAELHAVTANPRHLWCIQMRFGGADQRFRDQLLLAHGGACVLSVPASWLRVPAHPMALPEA